MAVVSYGPHTLPLLTMGCCYVTGAFAGPALPLWTGPGTTSPLYGVAAGRGLWPTSKGTNQRCLRLETQHSIDLAHSSLHLTDMLIRQTAWGHERWITRRHFFGCCPCSYHGWRTWLLNMVCSRDMESRSTSAHTADYLFMWRSWVHFNAFGKDLAPSKHYVRAEDCIVIPTN